MMKKAVFVLVICIFLISIVEAEIRINEVELNPEGDDNGNEWVEIYSSEEINLTNWVISSSNGRNMTFNASFSNYYNLTTITNLLTNDNNNLTLKNNNSEIIFSTNLLTDSSNDNRTWQFCSWNWTFRESTKGAANNCTQSTTTPTNTTNTTNSPTTSSSTPAPYVELDWEDDEIFNKGEEFEIDVKAYYLLDEKYDVKVWIENDDEEVISERYGIYADDDEDSWKAGSYYAVEFLNGNGNRTKTIKIRLKSSYNDFEGEAIIKAKIRESDSETEKDSFEKDIDILEKNSSEETETNQVYETFTDSNAAALSTTSQSSESVIVLGKKQESQTKTTEKETNSIIYKSKNEYIKDYLPYVFGILCIIIIIFLMIDKNKNGK